MVDVKMDILTSEAGIIDVTENGVESISWLEKSFTKSGQNLMVDLSECVNDVQISSLQYCSDQDEIHVTVIKPLGRQSRLWPKAPAAHESTPRGAPS